MPAGLRFGILHRTFRRRLDEEVKDFGLTGVQFGVLAQLGRLNRAGNDAVNQKALEDAAHITHSTMTEILKKLEKKGFITLRTDEHDRRSKIISATDAAQALRRAVGQRDDAIFTQLCEGMSEDEVAFLLACTDKMLENARKMKRCEKGCEDA